MLRIRSLTIVAATLFVAGCYSPSYQDCQVSCPGGTCPSGLTCDTTRGVCRPEGAVGACPAGTTDGGKADGRVEGDAAVGAYCASRTDAIYCEDFDVGTIETQGWDTSQVANGGVVSLAPSERSMPNALRSFTPSSTAASPTQARIAKTVTIPADFQQLVIELDINFQRREAQLSPAGAFRLDADGEFALSLTSNGADQTYTLVNEDPNQQVFDSGLALGTWYRYQFVALAPNGTPIVEIYGSRDGVPLGDQNGRIGVSNRPPVGGSWRIGLGALNGPGNGISSFDYDNIVITVTP